MKVDKLNKLLLDEKLIQSSDYEGSFEIVNKPIDTDKFQLQYQNSLKYQDVLKVLGKPFSDENRESIWNILVTYGYEIKKYGQFIYQHSSDVLDTWARNDITALTARTILLDLIENPQNAIRKGLPKTSKPKVDLE